MPVFFVAFLTARKYLKKPVFAGLFLIYFVSFSTNSFI